MAVTRINNNQITTAVSGNAYVGINAASKLQNYSITSNKIANSLVYGSDLTVSGNLTVNGTTTTVNTINTVIADPLIVLADGQTSGTPTVDIGTVGLRGSQNAAVMAWKENQTEFVAALSNVDAGGANLSNTTFTISSYANFHANTLTANANLLVAGTTSLAGNIISTVNVTGNINVGNVTNLGTSSTVGNVIAGNVTTAGLVSATANVTGGNLLTGGLVSATSNITGGNVLTGGIMSSTGNATHGNVLTGGLISATGNVTGNYILGNGSQLTGVSATSSFQIANGTSSVSIPVANGNVVTTVGGTSNVIVVATSGAYVTGVISANGNVTGGNVLTGGLVSATANVTGGNILTGGLISATSTITSGANITGGNVLTGGLVSATANITGGNVLTGGLISAGGNVSTANIAPTGNIIPTANATYTLGNATNAWKSLYVSGNTIYLGGIQLQQTAANSLNLLASDGSTGAGLTLGNISSSGNVTGGNILTGGLVSATGNLTAGNVSTAGNVTAANVTTPVVRSTSTMSISTGSGDLTLNPTGNVAMSGKNITGLADPYNLQDAATKAYVDNTAQGLDVKTSCYAATTGNLATATSGTITYNNGNAGVGATLTTTGTFLLIDGANVQTVGTRILVKNEGNAAFNGIYTYANTTTIVRSVDFDNEGTNGQIPGAFTFVELGTINDNTGWVCTTNPPVVMGTTAITFSQFSGAGTYTANTSAGISLTGTVFSALVDNNTTAFDGNGNIIVKAGANLTTPNIGAATGTSLSVTGAVNAGTTMSAAGNVTFGNILTGGLISATGNLTSGNVNTTNISLTGNVLNALNVTGNITGGNLLSPGLTSTTGNATHGNVLTGGLISATGNLTSGNVNTGNISLSGNVISAFNVTGNITGGNLLTPGLVSATANVTGGNILTGGLVNATATITGGNLATGGTASATGNITGGNVLTAGIMSSTGNAVHGNISTAGLISATGNVTSGNVLTGGLVSATATITGGNLATGGTASATGNITGGNVLTGGLISATGNITTANTLTATGTTATGVLAAVIGTANTTGHGSAVITAQGNANSSAQFAFQNANAQSNASADIAVYNNLGTDTTYFIDMGITSSTFDGTAYGANIYGANDGYVYVVGNSATGPVGSGANVGNLILGSTNGQVIVFVGNASTSNAITRTSPTGFLVTGVVSATGNGTFGNIVLSGNNINQLNANSIINVNGASANTNFAVNGNGSSNIFFVNASTNSASFGSNLQITNALVAFNAATSIVLPTGNTAQRPSNASSTTGMLRFNTTLNSMEVYNNSAWLAIGSSYFTVISDEQFNGDGSTVAFNLGSTQTTNSCIVSINGVVQVPTVAYSVAGTYPTCVLTFTEAPATADLIDVRELTTTSTVTQISNNSGNATVTGNATAAEVDVVGNLVVSGSISAVGGIVGLSSNKINNGTSWANIASANSNLVVNINGSSIVQFTTNGIENLMGNATGNIGNSTGYFNTIFAKATSAQYADLAEKYVADAEYAPGTVVSFGGDKEVTVSGTDGDRRVAGVVSTNPSYIMNGTLEAEYVATIALTGRVPTSVTGTVVKGDLMVSNGDGTARAEADPKAGAIIGKALENFDGAAGVIEVVIGRF